MKRLAYTFGLVFLTLVVGCGASQDKKSAFKIKSKANFNSIQQNSSIEFRVESNKQYKIDSIRVFLNQNSLEYNENRLQIPEAQIGNHSLDVKIYTANEVHELRKKIRILSDKPAQLWNYEVLASYDHDTDRYTQGLEFVGDTLYESTGQVGNSYIYSYNPFTGESFETYELSPPFFGEGITLWENRLIHLTWRGSKGFIYDKNTLEPAGEFIYDQSKEGWGLSHDQDFIYKSDGTEKIWRLSPENLEEQSYIQLGTNKSLFKNANELEIVNEKIFANVYLKESVMVIAKSTGVIEGILNFSELKKEITKDENWDENNSVLNGIAYHKERKSFFITGKNWNKIFEVRISPPSE